MKKLHIGILTSGGDAPGMNAAIRAIVLAAEHHKLHVTGFLRGYNGLVNDEGIKLTTEHVSDIIHRGGTIIKSARCTDMRTEQGLQQAATTLLKRKIDALIVIGGDGSFTGAIALNKHWHGQIIGIPGTIDNDLDQTDLTIGFSTAVETAIQAIDKIRDTADAFERIFAVEIMGRHSGHLAFNVGIASAAQKILSFENFPSKSEQSQESAISALAQDITNNQATHHGSYIIVLAENLIHGGATKLAEKLSSFDSIDCTPCVLGHIQRGGSPVAKDRTLATKMGVAAINYALSGVTLKMTAEQNNRVVAVPLSEVIKHQKRVSQHLIDAQENLTEIMNDVESR